MLYDLRYALRMISRAPGFTLVAALTLALGIGANTAIFSVINAVLLKPLPYREAGRIARLNEGRPGFQLNVSYPNFLDWRARARTFEDMAIYNPHGRVAVLVDGRSEAVAAGTAESRVFTLLGMTPAAGRLFTDDEQKPGAPAVALISHALWQRRFAGSPSAIGRSISLGSTPTTIVGVVPAAFRPQNIDVWYPLGPFLSPMQLDRGNHPGFQVFARLRDGVSFEDSQKEMTAIAADLEQQYPATNHRMGVFVRPLIDTVVGRVRPMLQLLTGAVAFLLLIASANVSNVLLARGLRREYETAVRTALGAGRARLVRLFLMESLIVSLIGGAAGLLLAAWSVRVCRGLPGFLLPRASELAIDGTVLAYSLVLTIATSMLFGLAPSLHLSRAGWMARLRHVGATSSGSPGSRRLRSTLVGLEVALSLALLMGAGLMMRTMARLADVDPGFRPDGLLAVPTLQPGSSYEDAERRTAFGHRLVEELRAAPGVQTAALAWPMDLIGLSWAPYMNFSHRPFPRGQEPSVQMASVTPEYFEVMRIPLKRGRLLGVEDRPGRPIAIVVNETLARKFLPTGDAIGQKMTFVGIPELADVEVVGIVADTLRGGLAGDRVPEAYCAYDQFPVSAPTVIVRSSAPDPLELTRVVEDRVAAIDPAVATYGARRLADAIADTAGDRRLLSRLLALFAAVALTLTGLGIAGVVSFSVAQRTQEIGVRMALGADAGDVIRLIVRGAMMPVLAGLMAGAAIGLPLGHALRAYLFQVEPSDPLTLAVGVVMLSASALAAAYIPARRATHLDPVRVLRNP